MNLLCMSLKDSSMFLSDKVTFCRALCKVFRSNVAMAFSADIMPYIEENKICSPNEGTD